MIYDLLLDLRFLVFIWINIIKEFFNLNDIYLYSFVRDFVNEIDKNKLNMKTKINKEKIINEKIIKEKL